MAVKNTHAAMVKKLKKQVQDLAKKEVRAKNKLRSLLVKMRKVNRSYKAKLAEKMRMMKTKVAEAQSSSYAKAVMHLEKQMLHGIETKGKALASALHKIEKKYAIKLKKSIAKKAKKSRKSKIK